MANLCNMASCGKGPAQQQTHSYPVEKEWKPLGHIRGSSTSATLNWVSALAHEPYASDAPTNGNNNIDPGEETLA